MSAGRFLDVTTAEYHRDPCARPSLSSSIACELIQRSPLHAWQIHPRLGGTRRESTPATTNGTLIHALLLGKGEEEIAVLNVDNFRTNAAKEARDEALREGKCVVKASDYAEAQTIAARLRERIAKKGISLEGTTEEKIEWTEQTEDGPILCRGMLDILALRHWASAATILDLKSISSADLRTIQRHIIDYGYDIQESAYRAAVRSIVPEADGRLDFIFLFLETEPPYDVTPIRLNGQLRSLGEAKWERACRTWAHCLKTKTWPGYVNEITTIDAPAWALL